MEANTGSYKGLARSYLIIGDFKAAQEATEALILIYTSENRTYVWAIPDKGEIRFSTVPLGQNELPRSLLRGMRSLCSSTTSETQKGALRTCKTTDYGQLTTDVYRVLP